MYSKSHIKTLFGPSELARISNRHTGGVAGQKGTRFEDYFATFRLAQLLGLAKKDDKRANPRPPKSYALYSQAFAIIDDLIVKSSLLTEHYQVKNVKSISWTAGSPSLQDDFQRQAKLCSHAGVKGAYYLVVPTESLRNRLEIVRRSKRISCSRVVSFPYLAYERLLLSCKPFRDALINITPFTASRSEPDKLRALAVAILGIWVGSPNRLTTDKLAKELESTPGILISLSNQSGTIPRKAENILRKIPGFRFKLKKGFLFWKCGKLNNGVYP